MLCRFDIHSSECQGRRFRRFVYACDLSRLLQFLPRPSNAAHYAGDGSRADGSRLEFGGIGGIIGAESESGSGMRIVKAIAIVLIGPLLGILVAFVLAILALPPDPVTDRLVTGS